MKKSLEEFFRGSKTGNINKILFPIPNMKKAVKTDRGLFVGKRGQFYLISAIIFGVIIIGIVTVSNYIQKQSSERIFSLRDEIKIESAMVLDYSLNQKESESEFYNTMSNFTDNYVAHYGANKDIYFLFGSRSNMTLKGIQEEDKQVILSSGATSVTVTSSEGTFSGSINPPNNQITVRIEDSEHDFNLNSDRNFYFILAEKVSGNEYIISG